MCLAPIGPPKASLVVGQRSAAGKNSHTSTSTQRLTDEHPKGEEEEKQQARGMAYLGHAHPGACVAADRTLQPHRYESRGRAHAGTKHTTTRLSTHETEHITPHHTTHPMHTNTLPGLGAAQVSVFAQATTHANQSTN